MEKIKDILNLFRAGYSLRNSAGWKSTALEANLFALFAAILATLHAFGVSMPLIDPDVLKQFTTQAVAATGALMAIYNIVIHVITTDKIGILPSDQPPTRGNAPELSATQQAQNIMQ